METIYESDVLGVATKTAMFLKSVNIEDRDLLHSIVLKATKSDMCDVLTQDQLKAIYSIRPSTVKKPIKYYTPAELGCNLGKKSKSEVITLLQIAGFLTIDSDTNEYVITEAGKEYGNYTRSKFGQRTVWKQCTNIVLRKLIK
jgi:hypothetical protein